MKLRFSTALMVVSALLLALVPAGAVDTYTSSCRIIQQVTGGNSNTWGTKANAAFAMLDACIASVTSVPMVGDVTLTTANNSADQARSALIILTGSPGIGHFVTMPDVQKPFLLYNNTNAAVTVRSGAGTSVVVPQGGRAILYTDGATNLAAQSPMWTGLNYTLGGTNGATYTLPTSTASIARTDAGQTFTGNQAIAGELTVQLSTKATFSGITAASGATVTLFTIPSADTDGIYNIIAHYGTGVGVVARVAVLAQGAVIIDQYYTFSSAAVSGTISLSGSGTGPFNVQIVQTSGMSQTYAGRYSKN